MKISDSQIRKGIIKEHAKWFLYDNITAPWDWDSVLVVGTFDKIDGRFIDFHIRHIAVYQSQQLHNIIQHVKHNTLDNNRRKKEIRRIRQYFTKSFGITMSEERYDIIAEHIEQKQEEQ